MPLGLSLGVREGVLEGDDDGRVAVPVEEGVPVGVREGVLEGDDDGQDTHADELVLPAGLHSPPPQGVHAVLNTPLLNGLLGL